MPRLVFTLTVLGVSLAALGLPAAAGAKPAGFAAGKLAICEDLSKTNSDAYKFLCAPGLETSLSTLLTGGAAAPTSSNGGATPPGHKDHHGDHKGSWDGALSHPWSGVPDGEHAHQQPESTVWESTLSGGGDHGLGQGSGDMFTVPMRP